MPDPLSPTQQRLRDMEILLRWEGELQNVRLREVFGVKTVQASRLMTAFLEVYGDLVTRSRPHAPVKPGVGFQPKLSGDGPDEYLNLIRSASTPSSNPVIEDVRMDLAPVLPEAFALATYACKQGVGLLLRYRSLNTPEGSERVVFPHALVRAARRWHLRAWCVEREAFRDFALGRIQKLQVVDAPRPKTSADDDEWNKYVKLAITAHPLLGTEQARLLRDEYLDGRQRKELRVRKCLLGYVVQDLRLAVDPEKQAPPEFQLALANADAFRDVFSVALRPVGTT